jgi:hypothetical protein
VLRSFEQQLIELVQPKAARPLPGTHAGGR